MSVQLVAMYAYIADCRTVSTEAIQVLLVHENLELCSSSLRKDE